MKRLCAIFAAIVLFASAAFACQECVVYEVSSGVFRAVSTTGAPIVGAKVKLRRAIKRSGDRPHVLSCLYSFDKGAKVKSTKTDSGGLATFRNLQPGTYWLSIRGKSAQVVRVVEVVRPATSASKDPMEFQASDSGFTGDQCDVLQAKDF